ncbi:hypothetical protein [Pelagibacterium lacus]|uniref:hypothetical protein n=1 Tax=Pelagibacterium lacus TaxID=2282655 RepID=UPI0011C06DA7|nr:hypothetical protein [Pelagibacterium lacus]
MLYRPKDEAQSERFIASDGQSYVSINTSKSRAFAAACLAEWSSRVDGEDRRWMLQHKWVTVPVDVLPAARERLDRGETANG